MDWEYDYFTRSMNNFYDFFLKQTTTPLSCNAARNLGYSKNLPAISGAPRERRPIAKKLGYLYREILVVTWPYVRPPARPSVRPSVRPSAPQGKQCKMLHFLASVGPCNLILLIHVVGQLTAVKKSIPWPLLPDRTAGSLVDPSSFGVLFVYLWIVSGF